MLAIAYVLFAVQLLAAASPSSVGRGDGIRIGLSRRQDIVSDGVVDIAALVQARRGLKRKYENTIAAYRRNTGQEPPISLGVPIDPIGVDNTIVNRATGSIPLTDDYNALWQGAISVGTPLQSYTIDFDTGSSDLFLPGPGCSNTCEGHKTYNPSSSSTSADRRRTFELHYGDGSSVSGEQYTDVVAAGSLTATGQALGAASTYSKGFSYKNFRPDGLLGMGYQAISQYDSPPFFQTLIEQKQTTQPVFAFKLSESESELFLGGVNTNLYTGSFTYVPVTTQAYWEVDLDSVLVDGTAILGRLDTIIDTGTTLILGDAANVQQLFQSIPGAKDASTTVGDGFYTVPCDNIPTVSLTFGGTSFSIDPNIFNFGRINSRDCVAGIASSGTTQSFWIVGDIFLRNIYTSFDLGKHRVGFATLK